MRWVKDSLAGFLLFLGVLAGMFLFIYAAAENNITLKVAVILGGLVVGFLATVYREHELAKQAYQAVMLMLLLTAFICFMMGLDLILKAAYWYLTTVFEPSQQHGLLAEYRLGFYAPPLAVLAVGLYMLYKDIWKEKPEQKEEVNLRGENS